MRRLAFLAAWLAAALAVGPAGAATRLYRSGAVSVPVVAGETARSTIRVPDAGPVSHVVVSLRIDLSRAADVTVRVRAPDGTAVVLSAERGGAGHDFGEGAGACRDGGGLVVFDDRFGTPIARGKAPFRDSAYRPEEPLALLEGTAARGVWALEVDALGAGGAGRILCWSLELSRNVVETRTAQSGRVASTLSYRESAFRYRDARVRIVRAGRRRLDEPLARLGCGGCPTWAPGLDSPGGPIHVRDLDSDGEPEVLVDLFSGGAHCCRYSLVYRYRASRGDYGKSVVWWGNVGYRLVDLNHDGRPELSTYDDRFAYTFTPYVSSLDPVRIWHFRHGRLLDVTRGFPAAVKADARSLLRLYAERRGSTIPEVRGILAAYLADQYSLGRERQGWAVLERAYRRGELGRGVERDGYPAGRAYLGSLREFLRRTGYVRSARATAARQAAAAGRRTPAHRAPARTRTRPR